jgi:hypothetical protein
MLTNMTTTLLQTCAKIVTRSRTNGFPRSPTDALKILSGGSHSINGGPVLPGLVRTPPGPTLSWCETGISRDGCVDNHAGADRFHQRLSYQHLRAA